MTNDDRPAASGGGPDTVSTAASSPGRIAADLPDKLRVHALAKLLGLTSRDVLAALADVGSPAKGAQSSIDRDTALEVVSVLLPDPSEPGGDSAEEIEDGGLATPLAPVFAPPQPLFLPPQPPREERRPAPPRRAADEDLQEAEDEAAEDAEGDEDLDGAPSRRRRRRGRRGRGRGRAGLNGDFGDDADEDEDADEDSAEDAGDADDAQDAADEDADDEDAEDAGTRRRRRRRRRKSVEPEANGDGREDDPPNTVVHVREARPSRAADDQTDGVQGVKGSTRLEAKRQRRRDGREAGRRRPPILSEAEFLARRESVDRVMVVREHGRAGNGHGGHGHGGHGHADQSLVQIGVLEDGVLVEHFVTSAGAGSLVGNVYLGRVQNVLPSMEAAFVDIGRGRNAVLYAGEVDWDAAGLEGKARKIEQALSTGDSVLVQVTKDPVGHKGARLTTQISLPGRFLVYVPGGGATGISRKLPDTERKRLKDILRRIVPEDAGVIIRTASEGVSEDALARDVRRLQAQWEVIQTRSGAPKAQAPQLLYEEPDLLIKVVRDLFTEDFSALVVQGRDAMDTIEAYVEHVAPDLATRLRKHVGTTDVFTEYRIDEQILKALDRKVWLPSGGYLVIDRTEAMTVIDVNTGKFTGSGGNLEETVTRNNLEAAEEVVRQLRLRDIGGIIVIDFIDMVLESNRDLVLRRLTECLGRDRTRHQVAEVTSLGLVQMTRKRVGSGLLEAYSAPCEACRGRGLVVSTEPVEPRATTAGGDGRSDGRGDGSGGRRPRSRGGRSGQEPVIADEPMVTEPVPSVASAAVPVAASVGTPGAVPPDEPAERPEPSRRSRRSRAARQADVARADASPAGTPPAEATQPDVVTAHPAQADGAQAGGAQAGARKADAPRTGVSKTGVSKAGAAKVDAPKTGAPKTGVTKADAPKAGAAKAGAPPADAGKADAPRGDAAEPAAEAQVPEAAAGSPSADGAGQGTPNGRSRRRRAASRPAGPPAADVTTAG